MSYKPQSAADDVDDSWKTSIGWLGTEFEPWQQDPQYKPNRRGYDKNAFQIMPVNGPPLGHLPQIIQDMMNVSWKTAEPANGAPRKAALIGTRKQNMASTANGVYHAQVRPVAEDIPVKLANDLAIASDWDQFGRIDRISGAATFRGDSRSPHEVIVKAGGFHPPNSRTDRGYLEGPVYEYFADYLKRRYQRDLSQADFLGVLDHGANSDEDSRVLVDYAMWRRIVDRESTHLARMASNQLLKAYVSTSRAIDSSMQFAAQNKHNRG